MESGSYKVYHVHGFHSRTLLETYCSNNPEMAFQEECLTYPMEKLHEKFKSGLIKGGLLIDCSAGPLIHHLYSASEFFKAIILLRVSDHCILELKKWLNARTGAFDWTHTSSFIAEKEGESAEFIKKEFRLKSAIKHVVKCNLEKENIIDPVEIPQADCLITMWLLELTSKNRDDYISNLKKFLAFLKPGGQLILIGVLNATYFTINGDRFHVFTHNEDDVRSALLGEGIIIDHCDIFPRKSESDLTDFKEILFITAHKGE